MKKLYLMALALLLGAAPAKAAFNLYHTSVDNAGGIHTHNGILLLSSATLSIYTL